MPKIELISDEEIQERLYSHLEARSLPDYFLYVGKGANNWLDLDSSGKFTVASSLTHLLKGNVESITSLIPDNSHLVSIGVGSGEKERIIIEKVIEMNQITYFPVDVSGQMVDLALDAVKDLDLGKVGFVGLFEDIDMIKYFWKRPVALCLFGNNFSNYDPFRIMGRLTENLDRNDLLIIDSNLCPYGSEEAIRRKLLNQYLSNDNIAFNLHPLYECGASKKDCEFLLDLINIESPFGNLCRTRKRAVIRQNTMLKAGGRSLLLKKGETINMGFTFKYKSRQLMNIMRYYNFIVDARFMSEDKTNMIIVAHKSN